MGTQSIDNAAGGKPPAALVSGGQWRIRQDRPIYTVTLWPNQSLTSKGLRLVLGVTALGFAMPLAAVAATPAFWGLAPFAALALWALWYGIRRNSRNLQMTEVLSVWRDEVRVERREANGQIKRWQSDPRDVRIRLHRDARIEDYLTLKGAGREIELGAFLSPEERTELAQQIEAALTQAYRS